MKHLRKLLLSFRLRALALAGLVLAPGCVGLRDRVESAADKRDVVCGLAANTPAGDPAVDHVRELCARDASLQEIARAYAGCDE